MKKAVQFFRRHALSIMTAASAFVVFVANSSPSACFPIWFYEEEMPECLQDN